MNWCGGITGKDDKFWASAERRVGTGALGSAFFNLIVFLTFLQIGAPQSTRMMALLRFWSGTLPCRIIVTARL